MAVSLPAPALLSQSPIIASNVSQASSIPACPSKVCAPCYITAAPYALTYPGIGIEIQNETYTLKVTPHVKQFPNGSVSTVYETEKRNFSTAINGNGSDFSLQLEEAYTWIVPGIGDKNLTLTYPTTYIQYNYDLSGVTAKDSGTVSKCAQTKDFSDITLPPTADPSSLIGLPSSTEFDEDYITIPASILSYLDSLPDVQDQFNHIPLTSCSSVTQPPSVCTSIFVSSSTTCLSAVGTGNLSHTHCSEVTVTKTSTVYGEDFTATKAATTGPIDIPRKPAAYLTYSTLTPSSITSDSPADIATNGIGIVTPTIPFHKESQQGPTSTGEPDLPPNDDPPSRETQAAGDNSDSQDSSGGDNGDSQDAPHQGSQAAVTQPEASQKQSSNVPGNIESAIGALVSKASASQDGATATAPEPTNRPGDGPDTEDAPQPTLTAGLGSLWSAIQGVASQVAKSDGSVSGPPAEHATGAAKPGNDQGPQQESSDGDTMGTHDTDSSPNAGSESDASEVPHDSSAEEATGGIVSGGTQISQKPAGNGGTAEIDDTNSTMDKISGSAAPEATADYVPVFSLAGQTLSPGAAVTFGGSHASELPDGNGVVVDGSQTVHLSAGQATTLQPSNHEPMTISRSGSVFAINGETLPPGQQIAAGQTTASLAQSSSVLYVNGKPTTLAGSSVTLGGTVYTASLGSSTSGDSLGGYIYSGIGGSTTAATAAASGSSPGGSESTAGGTTGVALANTGAASRSLAFTLYAWPMGVIVLWFL